MTENKPKWKDNFIVVLSFYLWENRDSGKWRDQLLIVGHCIINKNYNLPFEKQQDLHCDIHEKPWCFYI